MNGSNKKNLHILIVPSWYKTPETPVLGTFFDEQAKALHKEGHTIGILYPEYVPLSDYASILNTNRYDFYVDKGIPTFNVKTFVGVPKMRRLSYLRFSHAVSKVFDDYVDNFGKPDIIHAHSVFHAGICSLYIAEKYQIPLVITEHLTAFLMGYINKKADIQISQRIFKSANAAIIVSQNFKKDLEEKLVLPKNTFHVIHNLVNELFFEKYIEKKFEPGEPFYFFTNSFLLPRKNIKVIIDAIKILADQNLDVHLKVGGEGPEADTLQMYVNEKGLSQRVIFTGKLFRNEVKNAVDDCHAFVLGSQYETFGVVLIESLACGRPVVTTNSGGPLDFIHPEHGVIVDEHTPEALAIGMKYVMDHYNEYNQQQLIEYCRENFSEKKITTKIISLYHSVMQNNKVFIQ